MTCNRGATAETRTGVAHSRAEIGGRAANRGPTKTSTPCRVQRPFLLGGRRKRPTAVPPSHFFKTPRDCTQTASSLQMMSGSRSGGATRHATLRSNIATSRVRHEPNEGTEDEDAHAPEPAETSGSWRAECVGARRNSGFDGVALGRCGGLLPAAHVRLVGARVVLGGGPGGVRDAVAFERCTAPGQNSIHGSEAVLVGRTWWRTRGARCT